MAHVLILSLVFPPDSVSTAQIIGELAVDLKRQGHAVTVITTCPHYNRSPENEKRQPLHPYWGKLLWKSDYAGIPVYHTLMPPKSGRKLWRALAWLVFHLLSTVAGMLLVRKPDV
ncbi:MAG: glycosyltransferase WbuB, partial [Kiritimatiellae bacterium]|nr:glycosyltransferase WbuB [Kiritimatiellia bacterium]